MTTYVIGDLHGCLDPLKRLLDKVRYEPVDDQLWFVGDLINRGPQSLQTLRYVKALGESAISVLGNHDLHLLAVVNGHRKPSDKDTLTNIRNASDCDELCHWLSHRPLLHHDKALKHVLVHAGIHPHWSLKKAKKQAKKVQKALREDLQGVLETMYGNTPEYWSKQMNRRRKNRFTINTFTRMRYCDQNGVMNFDYNGPPACAPKGLFPWYCLPNREPLNCVVVFGHWSSHPGIAPETVLPTDRGCVWRGHLTAYAVESRFTTTVPCKL